MTDKFVKQVGGDHYGDQSIGHWDLMEEFDISYLEATASKYIIRYDRKGKPREDLEKAKSYLQKVIVQGRDARRTVPASRLQAFYQANDLSPEKISLCNLIHEDGRIVFLDSAMIYIDSLLSGIPT